jgi:6-phospho-3-hexuloisomerase
MLQQKQTLGFQSGQYAGSLFEQFTLFILEGVFMTLWQESELTKEDLWPKHANLE